MTNNKTAAAEATRERLHHLSDSNTVDARL